MKCLETRARAGGLRFRRYQLADGRILRTLEMPITVVKAIGAKRVTELAKQHASHEPARAASHARRQTIEALLRERVKPAAIAHQVGVSETRVRQIRQELSLPRFAQQGASR